MNRNTNEVRVNIAGISYSVYAYLMYAPKNQWRSCFSWDNFLTFWIFFFQKSKFAFPDVMIEFDRANIVGEIDR